MNPIERVWRVSRALIRFSRAFPAVLGYVLLMATAQAGEIEPRAQGHPAHGQCGGVRTTSPFEPGDPRRAATAGASAIADRISVDDPTRNHWMVR